MENNNLQLPTEWICDKCGTKIESVNKGWLEWYEEVDESTGLPRQAEGFRIVHHISCMYNEEKMYREGKSVSDMHLDAFNTPSGLERLLEFIEEDSCKNNQEVTEIIKRLFVLGYEENR